VSGKRLLGLSQSARTGAAGGRCQGRVVAGAERAYRPCARAQAGAPPAGALAAAGRAGADAAAVLDGPLAVDHAAGRTNTRRGASKPKPPAGPACTPLGLGL